MKKFIEAQEPKQFAISLIGEPTLYPKLPELIKELRKNRKTSFLVTNGLYPNKLLELKEKNALPTQIYISLNSPNKKEYKKWHKSKLKDAWKRFNKSLDIMRKLNTRRVVRITLVRNLNMIEPENYAKLILKTNCDFVEVKGYMAVGYARKRLGYERMPSHSEVKEFSKKLLEFLPGYKLLDEQEVSRVVLLGRQEKSKRIHNSIVSFLYYS
jgi:tRNA wybutosine-synthesizing protein 1